MPSSQLCVGAFASREDVRGDGLGGKTLSVNIASGDEGEAEDNWAKAKEEDENETPRPRTRAVQELGEARYGNMKGTRKSRTEWRSN